MVESMGQVQDKYRILFEEMAQGAFYRSADGSITDVNRAALAMFGKSRKEFLACTPENRQWRVVLEDGTTLPPEKHPSVVALQTGQPVRDFIAGIYHAVSRSYIWININAIPLFRAGETIPHQVFVTLHDVSHQKRMSDIHLSRIHLMQFADSHTLHELLVEVLDEVERLTNSAIGFYHMVDERTRQITLGAWSTRTTREFCRMEGGTHYSVDKAGVWLDCVREDRAIIHNDYASLPGRKGLPKGHAPVIRELVVPVKRNGRVTAVLGIGNKEVEYTEADVDTVTLFADLTWDITERKKGDGLLLQAQRQLEILTNTAMDGYCVVDGTGRIVSANQTCCDLHGLTKEEMLTKKVHEVAAIETEEDTREHFDGIKARGYDRFEGRLLHSSGRLIDVEISAAYLPESDQILAFTRDITERKHMQEALQQANEFLEHRVSQRTADLQAAIREQEAFSYSVSHDLRAPLRHINSFCGILVEDHSKELSPQAREYLDRMKRASSRMGSLIDHLLELSRVARTEVRPAMVNLSEAASAALVMLAETEPNRRVEALIEPDIVVLGDQHLLGQLLGNLLGNAWKYTSAKPLATIEFGTALVSGQEAYFVRDNGVGFDMTYRHKLFMPFERLHGSEIEGVGIGLATAQRIVQRHGGVIWAEGVVGKGATFYFTLPLNL